MNNNYNSDMYLTPNDLNNVENKIEELTEKIRNKIYNNVSSPLRNIQIGDDLSGKTLYLFFPHDVYQDISNTSETYIINTDEGFSIGKIYLETRDLITIRLHYTNTNPFLYSILDYRENPYLNYVRFKLPDDFGIVTNIDSNDTVYQYIKIYENENIIPNYIKKQWFVNDIPFIQDIDNIEQGIENLGKYCTKPLGWITTKEWIEIASVIKRNDLGVGSKSFSYRDINRWINNLNLIDNVDMDNNTFWNTNKTMYNWNEESE